MHSMWKFKMWLIRKNKSKSNDLDLAAKIVERTGHVVVQMTPTQSENIEKMSYMDTLFDRPEQFEDDEYDDFEDDEEEFDSFEDEVPVSSDSFYLRVNNLCDGFTDLATIADTLRQYADFLDTMDTDGYVLANAVQHGEGWVYRGTE